MALFHALGVLGSGVTHRLYALGNIAVADPSHGFADIRTGNNIPHFTSDVPVFDLPAFDA
jgi:hypothetical protein